MSRLNLAGVALTLSVSLASLPAPARAEDQEGDPGPAQARPNGEVSVEIEGATPGLTPEVFQTTLAPYGDWMTSARYGQVWRPRVAIGWRPYYYGSWQWTDEGWYWDSSEPFAWAAYHYGRWVYDPAWGWVWVPGYQWAPAWVTWRYGHDAVGWAPLGPSVSVFVTTYPFVDFWWTFVPCNQFVGAPVHRVAYAPRDTRRWFGRTAPAPPRTLAAPVRPGAVGQAPAWGGPNRRFVEERIGRPIVVERRTPAGRPESRAPAVDRERAPMRERPAIRETERAPGREFRPPPREPERAEPTQRWGGPGERAPGWGPPPAREERGGGRPEVRSPPPRAEPRAGPPQGGRSGGGRPGGEPRRSR